MSAARARARRLRAARRGCGGAAAWTRPAPPPARRAAGSAEPADDDDDSRLAASVDADQSALPSHDDEQRNGDEARETDKVDQRTCKPALGGAKLSRS